MMGSLAISVFFVIHAHGEQLCLDDISCGHDNDHGSNLMQTKRHSDSVGKANGLHSDSARVPAVAGTSGLIPDSRFFFGIKSGPTIEYVQRRSRWRDAGCHEKYRENGISYAFFIGVPLDPQHDLTAHRQDGVDTKHEQSLASRLLEESDKFGDLQILPMREAYEDLSDKLLQLLNFGYYHTSASFIGEHDDEYCLSPATLLALVEKHESEKPASELYGGAGFFAGNEYASQKGVQGMVAPYMTGHASLLSRGLVQKLVVDDYTHSVLNGIYGTHADDANLGKWVKFASERHGINVNYVTVPDGLITDVLQHAS